MNLKLMAQVEHLSSRHPPQIRKRFVNIPNFTALLFEEEPLSHREVESLKQCEMFLRLVQCVSKRRPISQSQTQSYFVPVISLNDGDFDQDVAFDSRR